MTKPAQPNPSDDEQIRAFLRAGLYELAGRVLGVRRVHTAHIRRILTVTPAEVQAWVAAHGLPDDAAVLRDDSDNDGIHLYRRGLRWHVWMQERGVRDKPAVFWKKRDAELEIVGINIAFQRHLFEGSEGG